MSILLQYVKYSAHVFEHLSRAGAQRTPRTSDLDHRSRSLRGRTLTKIDLPLVPTLFFVSCPPGSEQPPWSTSASLD